MNIAITLDTEATDVLTAKVAARNAALPQGATPYTIETHLAEVLSAHVSEAVREAYNDSLRRLGTAAASLPYANRKALIEQVEASIP